MDSYSPVYANDTREAAAFGLAALMSGISEEYWCAGWLDTLAFDLWEAAAGMSYGMGTITERQATLLRLLSEEAHGWWHWQEDEGARFVSLEKWQEILNTKKPRAPEGSAG